MRLALITPWYHEAERGNAVTVRRIERYLRHQGCDLTIFALDERSGEDAASAICAGRFDLCHSFHAYLGGIVARKVRELLGTPYIITLTGSDIYQALLDSRREELLTNLQSASFVVAFHPVVAQRLAVELPAVKDRITVIPQGVDLPRIAESSSQVADSSQFIFLLPAGMRPVKNLLFPLHALAELHAAHPEIRLHLVGPVIDHDYAAHLLRMLPEYPFARYLGVVAHDDMNELYRNAQVVLNSSQFEGGMANSLLEAMAWGKPVLASDIEGNRSLVTDGVNGLLYRDSAGFIRNAEMLLMDAELRMRLGMAGRRTVEENHSPEREAAAYLRLYEEVVENRRDG